MQKAALFAIALTVAILARGQPAHATATAWSAVEPIGPDSVTERCIYPNFESCQQEASGGNRGFCRPSGYAIELPAPHKTRKHTQR